MNRKNGKAGTAVAPAEPDEALEACDAEPGSVESVEASGGNREKTSSDAALATSWIEIKLIDEADQPVAGETFKLVCADDSVRYGTLDPKGFARVERIPPGSCKVTFPNLDEEAWEPA